MRGTTAWHIATVAACVGLVVLTVAHVELRIRVAYLEGQRSALLPRVVDTSDSAAELPSDTTNRGTQEPVFFEACRTPIPAEAITEVVRRRANEIFACVRERERAVDIVGLLGLALQVQPDGSVVSVRLYGSVTDPEVTRCAANSALAWRFDRTADGCTEVHVPFGFAPGPVEAPPER